MRDEDHEGGAGVKIITRQQFSRNEGTHSRKGGGKRRSNTDQKLVGNRKRIQIVPLIPRINPLG